MRLTIFEVEKILKMPMLIYVKARIYSSYLHIQLGRRVILTARGELMLNRYIRSALDTKGRTVALAISVSSRRHYKTVFVELPTEIDIEAEPTEIETAQAVTLYFSTTFPVFPF